MIVAITDQNVFPPIQVHVDKGHSPAPFRSIQTGQAGQFSKTAIAARHKKGIPLGLRPVERHRHFRRSQTGFLIGSLRHAQGVALAQHLHHQKIIHAISIDISDICSHGGPAGLSHGTIGKLPKNALSLIDPALICPIAKVIAYQ